MADGRCRRLLVAGIVTALASCHGSSGRTGPTSMRAVGTIDLTATQDAWIELKRSHWLGKHHLQIVRARGTVEQVISFQGRTLVLLTSTNPGEAAVPRLLATLRSPCYLREQSTATLIGRLNVAFSHAWPWSLGDILLEDAVELD